MTSENVTDPKPVESAEAVSAKAVDDQLIDELVHRAQAEGLQLTGEGGLLQQLTKRLLESALEGEITDHLGTWTGCETRRNTSVASGSADGERSPSAAGNSTYSRATSPN
ncbi:hypothetical protein GCM10022232_85200 [Streptomyces plumbiresistens]|uniref:Transposase n=1 Tax=Streptomyces plumbiresistens TaxID=511811 RepID=A0ABP7THT8_9ACTN